MIQVLFSLIDVLVLLVPILLSIAFMTILERKQLASHQRRVGPVKRFRKSLIWEILSNSGNILKFKIPFYFWKVIKYILNSLCKVIILKMSENKMDNRGSKSVVIDSNSTVKEQRVDGSWLLNLNVFNSLRCTLRGFERITLYGSLSYQILNKHLYSTKTTTTTIVTKESKNIQSFIQK